MTDQQFADSLNAIDRPVPTTDANAVQQYMINTEFRNGSIYGRLHSITGLVADATGDYGTLGMGASQAQVPITVRHVAAAYTAIRATIDDQQNLTSTEWDNILDELTTAGQGAQAMSEANKTAIQELSNNRQSRATELGLPKVSVSHISRIP